VTTSPADQETNSETTDYMPDDDIAVIIDGRRSFIEIQILREPHW